MNGRPISTHRDRSLAIGIVLGGATFLLSPYGPRVSPDSGHYIFMTLQALHAGPFGVAESWWPPGFPWLLALVSSIVTSDLLTASHLLNATSIGVVCAIVSLEVGRAFDAASMPRRLATAAAALLGLALFNAAYVSDISAYVWSECPFLALVTLGLFFIGRHRSFGWGVLLLAGSWSVRFVGILTVPLIILALCQRVLVERRALRTVLAENVVPLTLAAMFVIGVLVFNRITFGFWMRASVSGPAPTAAAAATDYFATLFGFLLNRRAPLGTTPTALALAAVAVAGLYGVWAAIRPGWRAISLRSALGAVDLWLAWALLYSGSMIWLMSHADIFGTNRFVTPVFAAILILVGKGLAGRMPAPVRLLALVVIAGLAGESTVASVRANAAALRSIRDSHRLVSDAHVRGTSAFKDADGLASRASAILFLQRDPNSYFTGVMAAALLPCQPFYYRRVEQASLALPVRAPLLVISEAQNAALPALLAHAQVVHQTHTLGLEMLLVTPTTMAMSSERPLSPGCR